MQQPPVYLVTFAERTDSDAMAAAGAVDGVRVVRELPPRRLVVLVDSAVALGTLRELAGVTSVVPDRLEQPLRGGGPDGSPPRNGPATW